MQHSPLPPTTCSWIAEWMDRRVVRELFPVTRIAITLQIFHPLIAFQQHP
jgi:hypothetical protein